MIKRSVPFTSQEYYNLIKELVDQQYTDDSDDLYQEAWIPAESAIKEKLKLKDNGIIDLTNTKKDKIKDFITKSNTIKIGNFLIKIIKSELLKSDLIMDICIYEEKIRTQPGQPCKMLYKLDSIRDSRFSKCDWNSYFNDFRYGKSIPLNIFLEIVRWLQAIGKLTSFV